MAKNELHRSDIGTVFILNYLDGNNIVDVSTATTQEIHFRKPNESTIIRTTVFVTDGTEGKTKYTTITDDLDQSGKWELQGYIVMSGGAWKTDTIEFLVHDNII